MVLLAENFDGLWVFVFIPPIVLAVLAAGSLAMSARGHWSGPALAALPAVLGGVLFLFAAMGHAPGWYVLLTILPAALGVLSMQLWSRRRRGSE